MRRSAAARSTRRTSARPHESAGAVLGSSAAGCHATALPSLCSALLRLPGDGDGDETLFDENTDYDASRQIKSDGTDGTSERALYTLCLIGACHASFGHLLPVAERFVKRTAPLLLAHMSGEPVAAEQRPAESPPCSPVSSAVAATSKLTIATSARVLLDTVEQMKARFRTTQRAQSRLTDFFTRVATRK